MGSFGNFGRPGRGGIAPPCNVPVVIVLASCACSTAPRYPPFQGTETQSWLAYEVVLPGRAPSDLLTSFEASARGYGCSTERNGTVTHVVPRSQYQLTSGEANYFKGVTASCVDGDIALEALADARVAIGCPKPTTRERCDTLLREISEVR